MLLSALGFDLIYGGEDPFTGFWTGPACRSAIGLVGRRDLRRRRLDAMHARAVAAAYQADTAPRAALCGERSTSSTRTDTNSASLPLCRSELRQSQAADAEVHPCACSKSRSHTHGFLEPRSNLLKRRRISSFPSGDLQVRRTDPKSASWSRVCCSPRSYSRPPRSLVAAGEAARWSANGRTQDLADNGPAALAWPISTTASPADHGFILWDLYAPAASETPHGTRTSVLAGR